MSKRSRRYSRSTLFSWKGSEWRLVFALIATLTLFGLLHRAGRDAQEASVDVVQPSHVTDTTTNRTYLPPDFGVARQSFRRPIH